MNVAVWIVTAVLAVLFATAGLMKLTRSKEQLVASSQGWAGDFPPGVLKMIGAFEVAGALGLILPAVTGIATWLVPAAAIGLALIMVGAAITHLRRQEYPNVLANLVLFVMAAFVAVARIGPQSF